MLVAEDTEADLDMLKEQQQMIEQLCAILAEASLQAETDRGCEQMRLMRLEQIRFVRMRGGHQGRIASVSGWVSPALSPGVKSETKRMHQSGNTLRQLVSGLRTGRSRAQVANWPWA